eukprot:scaffold165982_cov14-Tisochrysis_lutea.AAC.1
MIKLLAGCTWKEEYEKHVRAQLLEADLVGLHVFPWISNEAVGGSNPAVRLPCIVISLISFFFSYPAAIERRIANLSMTPVYHGEGLQVLRYEAGQKYEAHWDYVSVLQSEIELSQSTSRTSGKSQCFSCPTLVRPSFCFTVSQFFDEKNAARGANRYATMLTFLETVEEGGETVFTKGDAVLFHSMKFNGEFEPRSLHGACPVIKGTKWGTPIYGPANTILNFCKGNASHKCEAATMVLGSLIEGSAWHYKPVSNT